MTTTVHAGEMTKNILPQIKKIIVDHAKHEDSYQLAYKKIQNIAKDAINYQSDHKSSRELDNIFLEIENDLSFDYLALTKEQMVTLILQALNS